MMLNRRTKSMAWLATSALAVVLLLQGCSGGSQREEIVLIEHSWESAALQPQIVAYIIEHGYDRPASTLLVEPLAIQAALSSGSADIAMEIWLPNNLEIYEAAIEEGSAIDIGESIDDTWQGIGMPQYVKDANPGLVSVHDLADYAGVFESVETGGKARFVDCVPGWACEVVNVEKWEGYGLEDLVHSVKPGSEAALLADLSRSYANQEPWLGYIWGPSIVSIDYDMYRLEEPPYTEQCWDTDKACAYPITEVKKLIASDLDERAPGVVEFLRNWYLGTEELVELSKWMSENHKTPPQGAIHYLLTYPDVWKAFVPADVAAKVEEAVQADASRE